MVRQQVLVNYGIYKNYETLTKAIDIYKILNYYKSIKQNRNKGFVCRESLMKLLSNVNLTGFVGDFLYFTKENSGRGVGMLKERRMSKLFSENGKSITLALDGYYFSTKTSGVDKTISILPELIQNGLNAVIVTYGMAKMYEQSFLDLGVIVRADLSTNIFENTVPYTTELLSVEDTVRLAADGLVSMTFPGAENEANSHKIAWKIAKDSDYWNVPFMCETLPYSYHITVPESHQVETLASAARIGTELGADIIKTRLTGHPRDREIIESAKKPVLVLGGSETTEIYNYFQYAKHCMNVGAKGVAVGRKITLDPSPVGVVAGLNTIIHKNGTVDEAYEVYQSFTEKVVT
ncbi:class I fructose-bisphosphate aldolase [Oceanobacillus timonensis]|uniref:class I fructose-bisphosphate aldolase n=1 Tax=Oceanobacillus timonensis TaxID=1926285 RepID=UPI001C4E17D3|nr:hypothetical protein [Oceanobacillus timonensis]